MERSKKKKFQQEHINNLDYQTESVKILEVKTLFFHNLEHRYEQLILVLYAFINAEVYIEWVQ